MFKDYKIPIAFLILILIIIFGIKIQAQNIILFDEDEYTGFWTPANLPIDTTDSYVYFYGDKTTTKVSKDSGGTRAIPYMRVSSENLLPLSWTASSPIHWSSNGTGDTLTCDGGEPSVITNDYVYTDNIDIIYSFEVLDYSGGSGVGLRDGLTNVSVDITSNGTYSGNYNIVNGTQFSFYSQSTVCKITNINFYISDSTLGYIHIATRLSDTTTFYYSQSVKWTQKDKDTIWLAAETDTVTVYPYIAPIEESGLYTSDGNELYTSDGNRIYAKQEGD